MYLFGLILLAGLMLVLPVIYLLLIAGVASAVLWHAVNDAAIMNSVHDARAVILLYFAPIVVGLIVILFMIKPLFKRRRAAGKPLTLSRDDQPLLYAYINQLCDIVGAPHPKRIDVDCQVNASASFDGAAGLLTGNLILTLGLPLAAGLDLRLFTGILAHELGHFAQGSGMRFSYVIRNMNGWFARVVYERDAWDTALRRAGGRGHYAIRLTSKLCLLCIWLVRRVLWCLMWVGSAASSIMSRQMEFDADRYQARVAGPDAVEQTFARLPTLNVAFQASLSELSNAWRERRLADDLPLLVCQREATLDEKIRVALVAAQKNAKTKIFDSHPCDRDRIASARRENAAGILKLDLPATSLFKDFKELSRVTTIDFYRRSLGNALKPEHLHTTEVITGHRDEQRQNWDAQQRYFQGLLTPFLPLRVFESQNLPTAPDDLAALIIDARTRLIEARVRGGAAAKQFLEALAAIDRVQGARALGAADIKVDLKTLGFTGDSGEELNTVAYKAAIARDGASATLLELLAPQTRRLGAALALAAGPAKPAPAPAGAADDRGEYEMAEPAGPSANDRIKTALGAISDCHASCERLRQRTNQLTALLKVTRRENNKKSLILELVAMSKQTHTELHAVHAILRSVPYPYEHAERGATISRYCSPLLPPADKIGDVHSAARATLDGVYRLYLRLMSDLAQTAQDAEEALGLPPLEQPGA
jgi:hypothetical protein